MIVCEKLKLPLSMPVPSWSCPQAVSKPVWHTPFLCVQWRTLDDGQRNCLKHAEFYFKNKFEEISASIWFYYKNLSRCTDTWTSNLHSRFEGNPSEMHESLIHCATAVLWCEVASSTLIRPHIFQNEQKYESNSKLRNLSGNRCELSSSGYASTMHSKFIVRARRLPHSI